MGMRSKHNANKKNALKWSILKVIVILGTDVVKCNKVIKTMVN